MTISHEAIRTPRTRRMPRRADDPAAGSHPSSRSASLAVLIGLVVLFVGSRPGRQQRTPAQSSLIGRPAPEAVGVLGDGTPFDLSRRKGSWVVLNFFQSVCVPCIAEHPELVEFVEQQATRSVRRAPSSTRSSSETRRRTSRSSSSENGGDWPVIYSDRRRDPGGVRCEPRARDLDHRPAGCRPAPAIPG